MGWLCGSSYDRFTIAPLDQTNACRAGLWNPSTSSLTRGPLGAWGPLHPPGPLTCRARRAREIDGLVVRVNSYDRFGSRHSTKRMHAVQGLWNPSTSSLTRGPWVPGAACITPRPSDMQGTQGLEKLMGWLCGSKLR
jgi:hypothetical protein